MLSSLPPDPAPHQTPHSTHSSRRARSFGRSFTVHPGLETPMKSSQLHLKFSLLGCQNAVSNLLFSGWFLPVSTGLLIYLIINVHVLYWRLPRQGNLFAIATPNSTNNQEKGPSITKVTALPVEVLFNLTVCKLACPLLPYLFLEA